MEFEDVLKVAPVVGVAIGLAMYRARQSRVAGGMSDRIRKELAGVDSLSLPDLVTRLGMRDGFMSRGKVMTIINPMVAAGEVVQEEPPGTTVKTRLGVLRFRLARNEKRS